MSTLYKQETYVLLSPCAHLFLHLRDATVVLQCVRSARHSSFSMVLLTFLSLDYTLGLATRLQIHNVLVPHLMMG